jgi:hypothetical protein
MIKNILQDIGGIGLYGVISLCLFFAVFSGALVWTFIQRTAFCKRMGALPLEDEKGEISYE